MYKVAEKYILSKKYKDVDIRFDLVVFDGEELEWLQNILWGDEIGY